MALQTQFAGQTNQSSSGTAATSPLQGSSRPGLRVRVLTVTPSSINRCEAYLPV